MTIEQLILSSYIGKNIKFVVKQIKKEADQEDNFIEGEEKGFYLTPPMEEWVEAENSFGRKTWERFSFTYDMIVSIKQAKHGWWFNTLRNHQLFVKYSETDIKLQEI